MMGTNINPPLFDFGTQVAVAIGLATLLLSLLLRAGSRVITRQRAVYRYSCRPAPRLFQRFPWLGTDFLQVYNEAKKSGRYAEFWRQKHLGDGAFSTASTGGADPNDGKRTLTATVWGQMWLFTSDAENIRAIHGNTAIALGGLFDTDAAGIARTGVYAVEPIRKWPTKGWIGDGVFTSDGPKWRHSRALTKPLFTRTAISHGLDYGLLGRHVDNLFTSLLKDRGEQVDLQPLFKRLYLDISTELLFGYSANSQVPGKARFDVELFEASFEDAMRATSNRMHARILNEGYQKWQQACQHVHAIFDSEIEYALSQSQPSDKSDLHGTFTEHVSSPGLSIVQELAQYSSDRTFLRDQLLNVFIGAKDTAAIGISDIFFHLARAPTVWNRVRAEVHAMDSGSSQITFEQLKSLKVTQAVISESLRLLSPVGRGLRVSTADHILPRGGGDDGLSPILVRKGTRVETSISALHYDEAIWGPHADQFMPERWDKEQMPDNVKAELMRKWCFAPFLGGARMCPAQQMMLTQYAYILVRFTREFKTLENRDPETEFVPEVVFSCQSKNGVKVTLS